MCFITIARNFGFGVNGEAFEEWAYNIPLNAVAKHRDNPFQVEAMFLGQAGLLDEDSLPEKYKEAAIKEGWFSKLAAEYKFLSHKFTLTPMPVEHWKLCARARRTFLTFVSHNLRDFTQKIRFLSRLSRLPANLRK